MLFTNRFTALLCCVSVCVWRNEGSFQKEASPLSPDYPGTTYVARVGFNPNPSTSACHHTQLLINFMEMTLPSLFPSFSKSLVVKKVWIFPLTTGVSKYHRYGTSNTNHLCSGHSILPLLSSQPSTSPSACSPSWTLWTSTCEWLHCFHKLRS